MSARQTPEPLSQVAELSDLSSVGGGCVVGWRPYAAEYSQTPDEMRGTFSEAFEPPPHNPPRDDFPCGINRLFMRDTSCPPLLLCAAAVRPGCDQLGVALAETFFQIHRAALVFAVVV